MKLLEVDTVDELGLLRSSALSVFQNYDGPIGSPEQIWADYECRADLPAEGPFLLRVNDEHAWASQGTPERGWQRVASKRLGGNEERWWGGLLDVYMEGEPLNRRAYLSRIAGMRKRLTRTRGVWVPWDEAYRWPEGQDLTWSGLYMHPWLETRENDGQREVRYREVPR